MIDHVTLTVEDFPRSNRFFEEALAPLGYRPLQVFEDAAGYGPADQEPTFWIMAGPSVSASVHVAFRAIDPASVDRFYTAALEAGGADNGHPGYRPHYHPSYYAAFVICPDGHNIEAVCHDGHPGTGPSR